jgi:hypothetical protein
MAVAVGGNESFINTWRVREVGRTLPSLPEAEEEDAAHGGDDRLDDQLLVGV